MSPSANAGPEKVIVRLLGPVDVMAGQVALPIPGLRRKAVLAVLGLHAGQVVSTGRLIEAVWENSPPPTAANALQVHVSYLRQAVRRPEVIVARPPGYALDLGSATTDLAQAQELIDEAHALTDAGTRVARLDTALAMWRGTPVADLTGLPWFADQSERIEQVRRGAEQARIEGLLELGQHAELVPKLEDLTCGHPFDEGLHRLLMIALYRSGRQTDALSVLRRLRGRLLDELGIDPGAAIRDVEAAILRQDPGLDHPTAVPGRVLLARSEGARNAPPRLVERGSEVALIGAALQRAVSARTGGLLLFEGPPGTGKTAMLDHARSRAGALGFEVMSARGSDLESETDWGCVRQLFEGTAPDPSAPAGSFLRRIGRPAGGAPEPRNRFDIISDGFRLISDRTARNPTLVLVDDLHWADRSSAEFVAFLAARLDGIPAVVVCGAGPDSDRVRHVMSAIERAPSTVSRSLRPLTRSGCAELLTELTGREPPDQLLGDCHDASRGNPFLLTELSAQLSAHDGADAVPLRKSPNIIRFVARHLRRFPAESRRAASALAVLGDDLGAQSVAGVARLPPRQAVTALSSLSEAGLVTAGGVPVRFSFGHPLIRSAVHDLIPAGELVELLQRAVEAALADEDVSRAAEHLLRVPAGALFAGGDAVLRQAADLSLKDGAVADAAAFLRRSLAERQGMRRLEILTRLGTAEALIDAARSVDSLAEALPLADRPEQRAEIALALAFGLQASGFPEKAALTCRDASETAGPISAGARQALQSCIARVAYEAPRGADLVALIDGFGDQRIDGSPGGLMLESSLAFHHSMRNRRAAAQAHARRAVADHRLLGHPLGVPQLAGAWATLIYCGDPLVLGSVEFALDHCRRSGSVSGQATAHWYRAVHLLGLGRLNDAIRDGRLAWAAATSGGCVAFLPHIGQTLMSALAERGDLDEARSVLETVRNGPAPEGSRSAYIGGELGVLLAGGRLPLAYEAALAAREHCLALGITNPLALEWHEPMIRSLQVQGRGAEARSAAADLLEAARAWGTPRAVGKALRVGSALFEGRERLDLLRESAGLLADADSHLEHARSLRMLGETLLTSGARREAAAHLGAALDLAVFCGARPVEQETRAIIELIATP